MNGLRHGFAASKIVLATEDRPHFDAMREAFIEKHQPADDVEVSFASQPCVRRFALAERFLAIPAQPPTLRKDYIRARLFTTTLPATTTKTRAALT